MVDYKDILRTARQIARQFKPQQIIPFGSYAYGTPTEDSDVDLMVVMNYCGREHAKAMEILPAVRPPFSVDLLVRKPTEMTRHYCQFDPLTRETIDSGKVLYERDGEGVARQGRRRLRSGSPQLTAQEKRA
jgi:predicted nucleotidyltransferase